MDDAAESGVVSEVLLVAGAIAGAVLLVFLSTGSEPHAPPAVSLTDDGSAVGGTKTFTVAATATPARWGEISILLSGVPLSYSTTLASDATYCVALTTGACAAHDPARAIAPGQQLSIHHTSLAGKTLQLRHDAGDQLLYAKPMHD